MKFALFQTRSITGWLAQGLNMIQPGRQFMGDLLSQLFDRLARIEDMPSPWFLRNQLLVASRNLLMVG